MQLMEYKSIKWKSINLSILILFNLLTVNAQRATHEIDSWKFQKGDEQFAYTVDFDDSKWQNVTIPHD